MTRLTAKARMAVTAAVLTACTVGCAPSVHPRSFEEFMEDGLAREGALARCNIDRDATASDIECENARRAAAAIAGAEQDALSAARTRESERKLAAIRERAAAEERAATEAAAEAKASAEAAYEAQWKGKGARPPQQEGAADAVEAPVFGAPLQPGLPEASQQVEDDVSASDGRLPPRPALQIAAAAPPENDIALPVPIVDKSDLSAIPRPFVRQDDAEPVVQQR